MPHCMALDVPQSTLAKSITNILFFGNQRATYGDVCQVPSDMNYRKVLELDPVVVPIITRMNVARLLTIAHTKEKSITLYHASSHSKRNWQDFCMQQLNFQRFEIRTLGENGTNYMD